MRELRAVAPNEKGLRVLRLTRDVVARDNNWSHTKPVPLKAGTVLSCGTGESGHNGARFFCVSGTSQSVQLPPEAYATRYPYDHGVFSPEYLEEIEQPIAVPAPRA